MDVGIVCAQCSHLNPLRTVVCERCEAVLEQVSASAGGAASVVPPPPAVAAGAYQAPQLTPPVVGAASTPMGGPVGAPIIDHGPEQVPAMERTKDFAEVAHALDSPSARTPGQSRDVQGSNGDVPASGQTLYFGRLQMQDERVPRLVVVKGGGADSVTFHLRGQSHILGRDSADISFSDDAFLSAEHAIFTSKEHRLFVQDRSAGNGVYLRIRRPATIFDGQLFLVGEQLLRLETTPLPEYAPSPRGTYFYGSPPSDSCFRVIQLLAGGGEGMIASAQLTSMSIGRDGNQVDFPDDRFISGHHAKLEFDRPTGGVLLTDLGSRNGTFLRLSGAQELFHGDYLFVGQQLLRVEMG